MTLLRKVMERPLDPSYAAAAAQPRHRGRASLVVTLVLAVLAGFVLSQSVRQIQQPRRQSAAVSQGLRTQITERLAVVRSRERANAALQASNAAEQRSALGASGDALAAQTRSLGLAAGELAVSGPGVEFTVDDAQGTSQAVGADPRAQLEQDGGIVLDADLQVIVNGLWAAGADAIAINGERLTALSAIRSAGEAILVDFRPLTRPYRIDAIGSAAVMQANFAAGGAGPYVQSLRDNNGIRVDIAVRDSVRLPGAGQLVLRAATPASSPSASSSSGAGSSGASRSSQSTDTAGGTG
jgi:uncharacterized protein YlxW (UPF0749 family)